MKANEKRDVSLFSNMVNKKKRQQEEIKLIDEKIQKLVERI